LDHPAAVAPTELDSRGVLPTGPPSESASEPAAGSGDLVARVLRWLPAALFGSMLFFVVATVAAPLDNMDTYFHLRFGHEFLHGHWSLWHPGSVSTFGTAPWTPTQWLPEMVMAQVEDWFGLAGVAWLSGLQQLGLICALYLTCRRWADARIVVILLVPTVMAASLGLSMRPQVLSYILVTVTVGAWLRTLEDGAPRWWLIPLTWLWGMLHGMWPLGIAIGLIGVAGLVVDRRTGHRAVLRAAAVPAGSAVAAALTPLGPALYGSVFGVGNRAHFFTEWAAPDFTAVAACAVLGVMLAVCAVLLIRAPERAWSEILFFVVAAAFGLWSYRTVPISAIILMALTARAAQDLLPQAVVKLRRRETLGVVGASLAALAVLAVLVPHTSARPPAQPAWVDPALSALPNGTKVVAEWSYDGYLMWKYPQLDLLMNGYGDIFTIPELQRQADIMTLAPGWDRELRATHCQVAVLKPNYRLAYELEHLEGWRVVHHSADLEMLVAPPGWAGSAG
jgi:hypothetical protein